MATKKTFSVTPGNPPCLIVGGEHDGKMTITGITGRTMSIAGHTTEVTMTFHCPPTGAALQTDKLNYDPATGLFLFPPPIIVDNPCGMVEEDLPAVIRILHLFKSDSGGADQPLVEEVPVTVSCLLENCPTRILKIVQAAAKKAKDKPKSASKPPAVKKGSVPGGQKKSKKAGKPKGK